MPWDAITTDSEYRATPNDDPFLIGDPGGAVGDLIAHYVIHGTKTEDLIPLESWTGGTSTPTGDFRGALGWRARDGTEPASFTFTPTGPISTVAVTIINVPMSVAFEEQQSWAGVLDYNDTPPVYAVEFPPPIGHPASGARGPLTVPLVGVGAVVYISDDDPGTVSAMGGGTFDSEVVTYDSGGIVNASYNLFAYQPASPEVGRFPLGAPSGLSIRNGLWFSLRETGSGERRRWYVGSAGWSG